MKKETTHPPPMKAPKPRKAMTKRRMSLSLLITQPLSIMISCHLVSMGQTMLNGVMR
jgi:hypothetical protein